MYIQLQRVSTGPCACRWSCAVRGNSGLYDATWMQPPTPGGDPCRTEMAGSSSVGFWNHHAARSVDTKTSRSTSYELRASGVVAVAGRARHCASLSHGRVWHHCSPDTASHLNKTHPLKLVTVSCADCSSSRKYRNPQYLVRDAEWHRSQIHRAKLCTTCVLTQSSMRDPR